jgi:hypothetical protein
MDDRDSILVQDLTDIYRSTYGESLLQNSENQERELLRYSEEIANQIKSLDQVVASLYLNRGNPKEENEEINVKGPINTLGQIPSLIKEINASLNELLAKPCKPSSNSLEGNAQNSIIEILEIKLLSNEEYEISIQSNHNEDFCNLDIYLVAGQVNLPLHTISILPAYLKSAYKLKIPLSIVYNHKELLILVLNKDVQLGSFNWENQIENY